MPPRNRRKTEPSGRGRWAFALAFCVLGARQPAAQESWDGRLPGDEGPLENATFLPTDDVAAEELARGDRALAKLRRRLIDDPALVTAAWWDVLDAWRAALEIGGSEAAVPAQLFDSDDDASGLWPDPDGSASRRVDGLETAVLGRLASLSTAERARWRTRFAGLGAEALAGAGRDTAALGRVERTFPATPAAFAAGLMLADEALERGSTGAAVTWLDRSGLHAELCGADQLPNGAQAALERRRRALAQRADDQASNTAVAATWRTAQRVREERLLRLRSTRGPAVDGYIGVRPGLCGLPDGSVVLQGATELFLIDAARLPRSGDPERVVRSIELGKLLAAYLPAASDSDDDRANRSEGDRVAPPYAAPGPPGWPLRPLVADERGRDVICVVGRLSHLGSNVVMRVRLPGDTARGETPVASLVWAVASTWRIDLAGNLIEQGPFGTAELEFHATPAIVDDALILQARERPAPSAFAPTQGPLSEIRAHAVALDLATGEPRWTRFLAKGTELSRGSGRARRSIGPWATQPVAAADGRAFLGTHLGIGSLVDAADGRLHWSLRSRRRSAEQEGWVGGAPVMTSEAIVWAPGDGDRLYWLDPRSGLGQAKILGGRAKGEGLVLVDGDRDAAVVLARAGARPALSSWNRISGGRTDALYLEPLERVSGSLVSAARTIVSTDRGLYLFDRERDDLLLSVYPYDPGSGGGAVFGHQHRLYVVGHDLVRVVATE